MSGGRRGAVHAIIVNYQTPELTRQAVEALQKSECTGRCLEIYLVDNGSADDSVDQLSAAFPDLPLIRSDRNRGFSGGNNLALVTILDSVPPEADRDDTFVLLLNSDVVVEPDALRRCSEFAGLNPDVGVVGPKVVLPDGRLDLACRRSFPTPSSGFWKLTGLARRFPDSRRFARYNLTYLDEDEIAEVDSVMGAFMLVRLSAIDQVGLLDERFFFYGEDLDWAYRIKARGWRVAYYPRAVVHHLKGGTTRRHSNRMIVEFYRAMWLFYRKHYGPGRLFLLNWLVMIGIAGRGLAAIALNALRPPAKKRVA